MQIDQVKSYLLQYFFANLDKCLVKNYEKCVKCILMH